MCLSKRFSYNFLGVPYKMGHNKFDNYRKTILKKNLSDLWKNLVHLHNQSHFSSYENLVFDHPVKVLLPEHRVLQDCKPLLFPLVIPPVGQASPFLPIYLPNLREGQTISLQVVWLVGREEPSYSGSCNLCCNSCSAEIRQKTFVEARLLFLVFQHSKAIKKIHKQPVQASLATLRIQEPNKHVVMRPQLHQLRIWEKNETISLKEKAKKSLF